MHRLWALTVFSTIFGLACSAGAKSSFHYGGKEYQSVESVLAAQAAVNTELLEEVQPGSYFGGSLLVSLPPDNVLLSPTFVQNAQSLDAEWRRYYRLFYKADAEFLVQAFTRSGLFDSVTLTRSVSYWRYATDFGYRYVIVHSGFAGFLLLDVAAGTETKVAPLGTGLAGLVNGVERALDELARQARAKAPGEALEKAGVARVAATPVAEEMQYDERTRQGWISMRGRGLEARGSLLRRIAEICATKNKLLISDEMNAARGAFKVLNEELKDGVFKISFEALY